MNNSELVRQLLRRYGTLQEIRKRNEKTRWFAMALANHRTKQASLSNSPVDDIVRHTAVTVNALDDFVDFFVGNLVSPNMPWLGMFYESDDMMEQDDMAGANEYIGKMKKKVQSEMAASNFYPQNKLATKDEFIGATSAILVRNDPNREICVYTAVTPWDYWIDTDQFGEYDTFFYKKTMNVSKAYEMFGEDLPKWMKNILTNGDPFETFYDFLLCIYPRDKIYTRKRTKFNKEKRFAVVWMYLQGDTSRTKSTPTGPSEIISESGSDFFPVCVSAWDMDGDNPYGTSPVIRNIEEINRTDAVAYESMYTLQKGNHPAFTGVAGSLESFSDDPGSRNVVASNELAPVPVPQTQTVDGALVMQDRQEASIKKTFNNDLFNYLSREDNAKVFTATQVNAVRSEQLSLLAAVYGNYQSRIDKLVKLTILTMSENNRLPSGADELLKGNGKLKVIIESPLAQELRAYTNRDANIALLEQCLVFKNIERDDAFLNLDFDEIIRGIASGLGVDYKVLKDKMKVQQEKQMIAEQQQAQAQLQAQLTNSEINRNNAGAANLNNAQGANQYGG